MLLIFRKKLLVSLFILLIAACTKNPGSIIEKPTALSQNIGLNTLQEFSHAYICTGILNNACWSYSFYETNETTESVEDKIQIFTGDPSKMLRATSQQLYTDVNFSHTKPVLTSNGQSVSGNRYLGNNTIAHQKNIVVDDEVYTIFIYEVNKVDLEINGNTVNGNILVIAYKNY